MAARQFREQCEAAAVTCDRQVIKLARGAQADPQRNQFVVLPEGAVEEQGISCRQPLQQGFVQSAAAWHECTRASACFISNDQADRVSCMIVRRETRRSRGYFERFDR